MLTRLGCKKMFNHSIQHLGSLYLRFEKRNNRPHPVSKNLPNLRHMFILHLDSVEDEFRSIFPNLILLNQSIDHHTTNGNSKFMEPIDETCDVSDGKTFWKSYKEEGGKGFVGQEVLDI